MYKGCDFGCKYCFANGSNFKMEGKEDFKEASISRIEKIFQKALETDEDIDDLNVELIRNRVPLHCGGMSDPFQSRERSLGLTKKLIELSNKYHYPICFSTKTSDLPDEYFEILNPEIHAFQISLMGWSEEYIRDWELNTPTAEERIAFMRKLRERGFWCGLRIQPLISIDEAEELVRNVGNLPSYITIEHVRIMTPQFELFAKIQKYAKELPMHSGARIFEIETHHKRKNFERLMKIANANGVLVGAGDNDLHHLSQSRCCCGIDMINENFQNYLKYNLTYMVTGDYDKSEMFIPKSDCKHCMNQKLYGHKKFVSYEELLKEYVAKHKELLPDDCSAKIQKELFGIARKRLF